MMPSITLSAPPKINLFLHITGQRDDGYHNLQTLFQLLDGGDQLTFAVTENSDIRLTPQVDGVAEEDNLIVRAAKALQQKTGCKLGCSIAVDKKLPMGAGLGGGSSNAATTLLALNSLWQCDLSLVELAALGSGSGCRCTSFCDGPQCLRRGYW